MTEHIKRVAVLIDAENVSKALIKPMLQAVSAYGHIATKRAYADFSEEGMRSWRGLINQHAIKVQHQFSFTRGKNASDIMMVIDAMDLLSSGKYDVFVLVSSDSDFTPLAMRLKESDKMVIGVGEKKAPQAFKHACDSFISASDLLNQSTQEPSKTPSRPEPVAVRSHQTQPEVTVDLENLTDRKTKNTKAEQVAMEQSPEKELTKQAVLPLSQNKIPLTPENEAQLVKWFAGAAKRYQCKNGWTDQCAVQGYIVTCNPGFSARNYGVKSLPVLMAKLNKHIEMEKLPVKGGGVQWFYRMREPFCYESVA